MTDLINTLEAPGEFDALTSLRPGEPYFLLVGRDRLAPPIVQKWADDNRARALREFDEGVIDDEKRTRELRKSTQAEAIGWEMASYKAGNLAKEKALAAEPRPSYSGATLPEETLRTDKLQSLKLRARAALNAAVSEVNELAEFLRTFEEPERLDEANILADTIGYMRASSEDVTPKRAGVVVAS